MEFKKKSMQIGEWLKSRAHLDGTVRFLAVKTGLSTQAIYNYVELSNSGKRDIRVIGNDEPEIYEVKRLSK